MERRDIRGVASVIRSVVPVISYYQSFNPGLLLLEKTNGKINNQEAEDAHPVTLTIPSHGHTP